MKIKLLQFEYDFDQKDAQIVLPVLLLLLVLAFTGCDRSYDDCILKNMRGVTSDVAAAQIRRSCRAKFPEAAEAKPGQRELDASEVAVLAGRAGLMYGNTYGGNLYNDNNGLTVTQVRIKITTKIEGTVVSRIYVTDVTIPPHSAKDFSFSIILGDTGADYSWGIDGAMGY